MNYMTVLARLYINFVTGINLESSFALWVNFLGISLPFLGSCSLWFTALFGIFHLISFLTCSTSRHCSVPFSPPFFKPRPLSFAIFLATSVLVNSCSRLFSFKFVLWKISSTPLWVRYGWGPQKNHENKFSLVSVMAAMLRDSVVVVVVVVVRTRPRAIPLAMITTRKSLHGFLWFPMMPMVLRLGAPLLLRGCEAIRVRNWDEFVFFFIFFFHGSRK